MLRGLVLLLQHGAELVAALVDRGDDEAHGDADVDEDRFAELEGGFDRLRHGVVDAEFVEFARVLGVAGAGDDREVGPLGPGGGDDRLDGAGVVEGDDEAAGAFEPAGAQELGLRAVAEIDRLCPSRRSAATRIGSASIAR